VCACEMLRRERVDAGDSRWGMTPFRIGLWVGSSVSPNSFEEAERQITESRGSERVLGGVLQLPVCPWCSDPEGDCAFSPRNSPDEGLPVLTVDEEIYRLTPGLVIATVDKLAQLPWKAATATLFGLVDTECTRHGWQNPDFSSFCGPGGHPARGDLPRGVIQPAMRLRPPDLIIQDELHLISGPLGSMVGLYESVVDRLATWELAHGKRARPKVIASTATARRAPRQIGALFDRRTEVFPPPGLDIGDNFFARQRPTSPEAEMYAPGRMYVGICAHGIRMKSTLIRVYVSVLGAAQKLHEKYGKNEITDPYMTLVGYFNSLRDLGGMRRLVEDDVSARLVRADERGLARRYDPLLQELTSRLSSTEIPRVLDHLMVPFVKERPKGERRPIDVLLATNMIAVGVDVPRLGIMVVANQPKSTAEYVQATSRIGRRVPGLVFTVFNWARPRDLSHLETFEQFHATIYRQVEALSVTPFADRAVDRGLTGVLVALVRDLSDTYNANPRAGAFDRNDELADHIVRYLKRRAGNVSGDNAVSSEVEHELDARLDQWDKERKVPGRRLAYDRPYGASDDTVGLLHRPEEGRWRRMTCQTSLRNVDQGIRLLLSRDDPEISIVDEPPFEPGVAASGESAPAGADGAS
jgi:hypothetical protein